MEYQVPPTAQKLSCSVEWEYFGGKNVVDLDVSAMAFDSLSWETDVAFYNNASICDGSVVHSGDANGASDQGNGESVDIDLTRLPPELSAVFLVVNCHTGGSFRSIEVGQVKLILDGLDCFDHALVTGEDHTAMVVGCLFRSLVDQSWRFMVINQTGHGHNFHESRPLVEQQLSKVFDEGLLLERPRDPRTTYTLEKDETYNFSDDVESAMIGLGWDMYDETSGVDVDGSVALFRKNGDHVYDIYFSQKEYKAGAGVAVKHSGDNTTGAGDGDDEQIHIYFGKMPAEVHFAAVVVNVYSSGKEFKDIKQCFVRLEHESGNELCRMTLDGGIRGNGLILGYFFRGEKGGWRFKTTAQSCQGQTVRDVTAVIKKVIKGEEVDFTPAAAATTATTTTTSASSATSSSPLADTPASDGGCCIIL